MQTPTRNARGPAPATLGYPLLRPSLSGPRPRYRCSSPPTPPLEASGRGSGVLGSAMFSIDENCRKTQ
eukprot:9570613-Lingulodinium_polyedra.AAC.1